MKPKVWRDVDGWTVSVGPTDIDHGLTWRAAVERAFRWAAWCEK